MNEEISLRAKVILLTVGRIIGWSVVMWFFGLVGSIFYFSGIIVIFLIAVATIGLEIHDKLSELPAENRQIRRTNRKKPKNADPHNRPIKYRTGRRYR
jgi:uncharacterized membrane protein